MIVNPKRILIAFALALLVSGLCTWLVWRKLVGQSASQNVVYTSYAAPSRDLQVGEILKPDNIQQVAWPGTLPLAGGFTHAADVMGREALFPLAKGQPFLSSTISAPGAGIGLATRIPNGMRAVALRSDEVVGVAGFLVPGSHLDVLVTYRSNLSTEPLTAKVLENVVVIAAGHQSEPDPSGKKSDVTIVTLLLTPEESMRAVLAGTQGAIHFVLRNGADQGISADTPILLSQLAGHAAGPQHVLARPAALLVAPTPKRHEIEMVFGSGEIRSATPQSEVAGQ
jgi:pilus assembly protein CpaB